MNKNQLKLLIPENMDEIHIVGAASASTPYNIRLLVYNEEIKRDNNVLDNDVNVIKKGKAEIVMHPQVAKNIAELLLNEVEIYQKKFIGE